uniref:Uncharacterized protein n=1 Tax=Fagus sylvatica TaxID=28930 RepID=A0A2N9JBJ2_FAGSY
MVILLHLLWITCRVNEISDTPIVMEEEVTAKVVEEIVAKAASDATAEAVVKTDVVAAETAYGAEATNDVEFNESESFDGAMRSVFPFFPQDKSIQRKRCLEARETPIDVVIPLHKSTCQGINNDLLEHLVSVSPIGAGDFDAAGAAKSATAVIQPPFASLERLGVQISAIPAKILDFFHEFDRVMLANIAHNTFGYLVGVKLIFMVTRSLVMEFKIWRPCGRSKRIVVGVTAEAVNDVTALGMIPKEGSHHGKGSGCRDVTDVADFEEIAPKIGTVILADAR